MSPLTGGATTSASRYPGGATLPGPDALHGVLLVVVVATAALIAVALVFALVTVILRLRNVRTARARGRLERAWEPALIAVLTEGQPPSALLERVEERDTGFFIALLLRYAQRLRGNELGTVRELARPCLHHVERQLEDRRPERRARAVQTLAVLGPRDYQGRMVEMLDDPAPLVAMVAARSLARREQPENVAPIMARLHRFEHWSPGYLSSLIAGMGGAVVPTLRATLLEETLDPAVRRVAADALDALDDIGAAAAAAAVAGSARDPELVAAALHLLGNIGRPEHAPAARAALSDSNDLVRARAAMALGTVGGEQDLLRLRSAIDDASPWVARAAAGALLRLGGVELLRDLAGSSQPRAVLARELLGAREAA